MTSHENLARDETLQPGSNRTFGLVMACAFAVLAGIQVWRSSPTFASVCAMIAAGFAAVAFLAPDWLARLNVLWFRFGLLLHRITNPLIMGFIFFGVVTPIGVTMRLLGKRPIKLERSDATYWSKRSEEGYAPGSLRKQF